MATSYTTQSNQRYRMYTRDEKGTAGKPGDTRQVNNATTPQAKMHMGVLEVYLY